MGINQSHDSKVYLETNDWERWYVGMDVSFSGKMMVAGNNKGTVSLLTLEGKCLIFQSQDVLTMTLQERRSGT